MKPLDLTLTQNWANDNIDTFHQAKLNSIKNLKLKTLLLRKNPYLYRAKNILKAQDLVESLLASHINSSEEELFGQFLEQLAIFIAGQTCDGFKSERIGIDLEFIYNDTYYIVQIKSGTSWGNSSQQLKQEENFRNAIKALLQETNNLYPIQAILGICYGKTKTSNLRGYHKIVGQNFWYFISENEDLYTDIIEPIGYRAKEHTARFEQEKDRVVNLLSQTLLNDYCTNGLIDWEKIVQFNSGNFDLPNFFANQDK